MKQVLTLAFTAAALLMVPLAGAVDDHLLLTEVCVTPSADEFIEIYNPTASAVALDNYYLADDDDYALLPGASGAGPAPIIGSSDFIVQFPAASSIPAGGTIIVAFDGSAGGFQALGFGLPDFEINSNDPGVPDMIATYPIAGSGLTNSGECVILFTWDGASDLVQDIDAVNIGTPSASNTIGDKSGVTVDGPDGDTVASAYASDEATMPLMSVDPGSSLSCQRTSLESGGSESAGSGNGITGDDETSENINLTWTIESGAITPGLQNTGVPVELSLFQAN